MEAKGEVSVQLLDEGVLFEGKGEERAGAWPSPAEKKGKKERASK